MNLSHLIATQARIEATRPKPQARGEGIRAVRQYVSRQVGWLDGAISNELADDLWANREMLIAEEPLLGDDAFMNDMGLS